MRARAILVAAAVLSVGVHPSALSNTRPLPAGTSTYLDGPAPYPGFFSSYVGHDGFRNLPLDFSYRDMDLLDLEAEAGLRWTFAGVVWLGLEPVGPTDAQNDPLGAWKKVDDWVAACRARGLNLLMQPVMSGNGIAPPPWAGYRIPLGYQEAQTWTDPAGKRHSAGPSLFPGLGRAPRKMPAAADWVGKLVRRYGPGGELAQERGWTDGYGVFAWEIDNEPDAYGLWQSELDDYAELVTRMREAIKREDPRAIVLGPAASAGSQEGAMSNLMMLLDRRMQRASLEYMRNGKEYALGPVVDAVSFHNYEDLDGTTAEHTYRGYRQWWDLYATQPGFEDDPDLQYWMTEGGRWTLDDDWAPRWLPQYLARGFAAGIDKMIVQGIAENGLSETSRSLRTFIEVFPEPSGMVHLSGPGDPAQIYRDGSTRWASVAWATAGAVTVHIPVRTATARVATIDGSERIVTAQNGAVQVTLRQAPDYNEPLYIVEMPG